MLFLEKVERELHELTTLNSIIVIVIIISHILNKIMSQNENNWVMIKRICKEPKEGRQEVDTMYLCVYMYGDSRG